MKKYLIEQVNIGSVKTGETNGRKWKLTNVGLKIAGVWYNSGIFDDRVVEQLKEVTGKEIPLELTDREYNGKVYKEFKIVPKTKIMEIEIKELREEVEKLKKAVESLGAVVGGVKDDLPPEELPPEGAPFDEPLF